MATSTPTFVHGTVHQAHPLYVTRRGGRVRNLLVRSATGEEVEIACWDDLAEQTDLPAGTRLTATGTAGHRYVSLTGRPVSQFTPAVLKALRGTRRIPTVRVSALAVHQP